MLQHSFSDLCVSVYSSRTAGSYCVDILSTLAHVAWPYHYRRRMLSEALTNLSLMLIDPNNESMSGALIAGSGITLCTVNAVVLVSQQSFVLWAVIGSTLARMLLVNNYPKKRNEYLIQHPCPKWPSPNVCGLKLYFSQVRKAA